MSCGKKRGRSCRVNMKITKIAVRYCGGCNPSYQRGASVRGLQKRFPHLQLLNFEPTDVYRAVLIVCGCSARCAGQADLPVDIPRLVMAAQEDIERAAEFLEKLRSNNYGLENLLSGATFDCR